MINAKCFGSINKHVNNLFDFIVIYFHPYCATAENAAVKRELKSEKMIQLTRVLGFSPNNRYFALSVNCLRNCVDI